MNRKNKEWKSKKGGNMGKDKKKVIIIAIVAIILIVLAIGVMLFFTTDIFKSDQELFFKYLAQTNRKWIH